MARISKKDNEQIIKDLITENDLLKSQLTNAKEIIKNLMVYVPVDLKEYEEAKQFLNKNSTYERIQKAKYNYTD